MEDPVGAKSLTSEEKKKIKEKLCLLQKEYKRTFNRLRRSQRAEQVKTHIQKTIAEHNRLLSQEAAEPCNKGSLGNITDSTGKDADSPSKSAPPVVPPLPGSDKERKPCVIFNPKPEILCADGSSPFCAGIGRSREELDATEEAQNMGQANDTMIQRSRLTLRRSVKKHFEDQSFSDSSLLSDALKDADGLQGKVMDVSDCGSAVFKKNGKHPKEQNYINLHGNATGPDFGAENVNPETQDAGNLKELFLGCVGTSPVIRKQCNDNKIQVKSSFTEVGHTSTYETLSDDTVTEQSRQLLNCRDNIGELSMSASIDKTQEPPLSPGLDKIKEHSLSSCLGKIRKPSLFLCMDKTRKLSLSHNTEKTRTPPLSPSTDKMTELSLSLNINRTNESALSRSMDKANGPSLYPRRDKTREPSLSAGIDKSRELPLSSYIEQNNMLAQKDQTSCDLVLALQHVHTQPITHIPTPLCSDEQNLINQVNNIQDATTNTEKDNNLLNSCTLVEGLLFPVEYYVRTTRRMSSCQRKVDLDAVIHSQLGHHRRGSRGKPRSERVCGEEGNIHMSPSPSACFASQFVSNAVCLTPRSYQTPNSIKRGANRGRRGRGRYFSPKLDTPQVSSSCNVKKKASLMESDAVTSPISNGSQSEKENCEEQATPSLDGHTSHACAANRTELQHVTEGLNLEQTYILPSSEKKNTYGVRSRNIDSLLHCSVPDDMEDFVNGSIMPKKLKPSNELTDNQTPERLRLCPAPSSQFPALSSRMKKLLSYLENKDFQLPDEDFGLLKLEKLKSVRRLEPVAPLPSTPTGRTRLDNTTLPCTDHSTAFQATNDVPNSCVLTIKSSACTLSDEKSYLGPSDQTASQGILCIGMTNTPQIHKYNSYPAPSVELLSRVSQTRESQELASIQKEFSLNLSQKRRQTDLIGPCEVDVKHVDKDSVPHPNTQHTLDNLHPVNISPSPSKEPRTQTSSDLKPYLDPCEELGASGTTVFQIKEVDLQFPSKEVPCSVLLSTSMCSMPLEKLGDSELVSCTPGFPFLDLTPAVLSAPSQGGGSVLTPCSPKFEKATATMNETLSAQTSADELKRLSADERLKKESKSDKEQCIVVEPCSGIVSIREKSLQDVESCAKEFNKDSCSGECMVDLCSVFWEFPSGTEMCIVVASESVISLWRPHSARRQWEATHSWTFTEMPVIQILSLPGEKDIMCVALGNLEILEIRALFSCPRGLSWEQRVVKLGHTETARGLSRLRLVCSSGLGPNQEVEILQLSRNGRIIRSRTLQSPEASILSFSEVRGQADAIVGSTVDNKVVIWNGVTGQLLSTINVGGLCGDSACLSAFSNSGLLFLVLASPYCSSLEAARKCIFKLIAANPKSELCAHVLSYTLPEGQDGRLLEGDIINHHAAAVLTSGCVAFWDLSRSPCSTILLPDADVHWSLVRWAHSMSLVLAGQKNGTICVYSYTELAPKEEIKVFEKNRIS
ncbi:partner and localizer of BRCA2 isoform X2 [Xenopus laevis]|uniref:Partner and localizer of BRCA2 isoform X2 n=1 Tax=Xenopus laevis TaxID=8355 RepID=A0A8J0U1E2_XENLA|nr:partner and localizer of BRCA2 isoform X2 [Xenopus laevis]